MYLIICCNIVVEECPFSVDQLQAELEIPEPAGGVDVEGLNNRPVNKTSYYDVTIVIVTIYNLMRNIIINITAIMVSLIILQCSNAYGRYVWTIRVDDMCGQYVWTIRVDNMYGRYVWTICVGNTCGRYVWAIRVDDMCGQYVWTICVITQ